MNWWELPPQTWDDIESYLENWRSAMQESDEVDSRGRDRYLTVKCFKRWVGNDFYHLVKEVKLNRKLLLGILFAQVAIPTAFFICIVQLVI